VVLPTFTFGMLYAWPFLEAHFAADREEHQLLNRPRDHPLRTAIGTMAFTFYALLLLAGSNDIIAKALRVPVNGVTWVLRILALTLPVLVALVFVLRTPETLRPGEAAPPRTVP